MYVILGLKLRSNKFSFENIFCIYVNSKSSVEENVLILEHKTTFDCSEKN